MKEIKALIKRNGTKYTIQVMADGVLFEDSGNFCDVIHSEGFMSDIFHFLTEERYKTPTEKIDVFAAKRLIE